MTFSSKLFSIRDNTFGHLDGPFPAKGFHGLNLRRLAARAATVEIGSAMRTSYLRRFALSVVYVRVLRMASETFKKRQKEMAKLAVQIWRL